ncbi:hypothetical protein M3O96_19765 [Aquiflexum sp. TKW24L]|uniref:hypothetical protein n=1 Tax=Aquiflexum sp. TKW24L TaxID=2942212 RepID=UPI0020C078D4|nr:hypothetical protein [Aquiflexum sp. TKW24L]MCL6261347.1 hypothetical protein [Aquiflexum sp. TKW24L]
MAKLVSWTKFVGTLGGITFYLMNGKNIARQARQKNRKRYWLSRFFVGTKKENDEFGRASPLSSSFRNLAHPLLYQIHTGYLHSQLSGVFRKIMLTDGIHGKGKRTLLAGDVSLLRGMEIAKQAKLQNLLGQMPIVQIDQEAGMVKVDFSKVGRINQNAIPAGASHFQVKIGIVQVPEKPKVKGKSFFSGEENYYKQDESLAQLGEVPISYDPVLQDYLGTVMVGIYFFQESNGQFYPLKSGGAVRVVEVWKG